MTTKVFSYFLLIVFLASIACSQSQLTDVTDQNDVLIDFEHIGKKGIVNKYLIKTNNEQINPPIPNTYKIFKEKYYKIKTDIIPYGETILTFNIPADTEVFAKVRILHLTPWELNPKGLEWKDCTITEDILLDLNSESYSVTTYNRLKKFLPNFSEKMVSCVLREQMKSEEYFVVTIRTQDPPKQPFTNIKWNLESKNLSSRRGKILYKLSFTNAGTKSIEEFCFRSVFDLDMKLNSFKPSQGTCKVSSYGSSFGSLVCYAGQIPAGKAMSIELEAENSGLETNSNNSAKKNANWDIYGYFKEFTNDPLREVNMIQFNPISDN